MILIGISGKKGTGKDLLASYLTKKHGFVNIPFAGELKAAVRRDFNLTIEHTDGKLKEESTELRKDLVMITEENEWHTTWTPREIMIAYGQFFRQFDTNYWVKKTFDKIQQIKLFQSYGSDARISISDVRFRNEANYIKEQGGYLVRLERFPELNIYKEQSKDISETDLDDYRDFDFVINSEFNRIPEDLERAAGNILRQIEAVKK